MEDRQTQVVSGAGLQESRINTEFVDFLSKWGPRVLYVVLAVVLAFLGWQQWTRYQNRLTDQAFAAYEAQVASRSPDLLIQVAQEHASRPAVWSLATRDAANLLMDSVIRGTVPGADPFAPKPEDRLTDAQRADFLARAEALYRDVIERNSNGNGQLIFAEQARWGLASALLSQGKIDQGREALEQFVASAETGSLDNLAAFGRARLARLDDAGSPPRILPEADLPPGSIRGLTSGVRVTPDTTSVTDPETGITIQKIDPATPTETSADVPADSPLPPDEPEAPAEPE